jgi:hypothetical protein
MSGRLLVELIRIDDLLNAMREIRFDLKGKFIDSKGLSATE